MKIFSIILILLSISTIFTFESGKLFMKGLNSILSQNETLSKFNLTALENTDNCLDDSFDEYVEQIMVSIKNENINLLASQLIINIGGHLITSCNGINLTQILGAVLSKSMKITNYGFNLAGLFSIPILQLIIDEYNNKSSSYQTIGETVGKILIKILELEI